MNKTGLRNHFKQIRKSYPIQLFEKQIPLINGIIGVYCPLEGEIDILSYILRKESEQIQAAIPYIDDQHIKFSLYDGNLIKGKFGILEPLNKKECILNFCFVPLLAFDPITKHRLGYGGGYYDRYIKKYRRNCIFIGVGHEDYKCQLPHELHDQALDLIVTNERIY